MAERPYRTSRLPDLVSLGEACEILGVRKTTLRRWLKPGSGNFGDEKTYIIPPKITRASPVWVRADLERFAVERGRQRALAEKFRTPATVDA